MRTKFHRRFFPPSRGSGMRGFTLIELAIVMAVVGLLIAATVMPLRVLDENREREEEALRMESIRHAVVGYALRHRTRGHVIDMEGEGVVANLFTVPAGRPYLPCPDVDGDGFEDRVPSADNVLVGGFRQGVEVNAERGIIITMLVTIVNSRPRWRSNDPNRFYGGCLASRGTIPWRTLGVVPADQWGNRYTYFADPLFAGALFGFDETTVANIYDQRVPRSAGLLPPLRDPVVFDTGLGMVNDRQCPAVICAGGLAAGGSETACALHAQNEGCAWNASESGDVVLKAGAIASELISDAIAEGSSVGDFPVGAVLEGVPFVIVSHGPNGRGAVNHWSSLGSQVNVSGQRGPVCNRGQLTDTTGGEMDLLTGSGYPQDNHEAMNAVRLAPGNGVAGADRRCPPLFGLSSSADAVGVELLPSVFVWEPQVGGYGRRVFDDMLLWMTREELALEAGRNAPRLRPLVFANP